jgi:DNA-binding NarL/FixJ family response regulator
MIRLLILEPQEIWRTGLAEVLSNDAQIEIVGFAATVAEVLSQIDLLKPDVLLLDECFDKNIVSTADQIGSSCIVFSNRADTKNVLQALYAGARAYVLKDTSIDLLVAAVYAVRTGASWLDPGVARSILDLLADPASTTRARAVNSLECQNLSQRELEVLSMLCSGLGNDAIAKQLFISNDTVKTHVSHIMRKMRVRTRIEAATKGIKLGLVGHTTPRSKLA